MSDKTRTTADRVKDLLKQNRGPTVKITDPILDGFIAAWEKPGFEPVVHYFWAADDARLLPELIWEAQDAHLLPELVRASYKANLSPELVEAAEVANRLFALVEAAKEASLPYEIELVFKAIDPFEQA